MEDFFDFFFKDFMKFLIRILGGIMFEENKGFSFNILFSKNFKENCKVVYFF